MIHSMPPEYTRKPIPWCDAFSQQPKSELKTLIGNTSVLRPIFKTASFREGVEKLEDLKPGMVLEGVVTNVAAFGAFVRCGGPPGRVGAHLRDGQCLRQRPAHNCEARRCRPCQGVGSRPKTPPDLADAAARCTTAPAGIAPTGAKKTPPARRDTFGAPAIPRPPAATRWPRRFGERGWRVRSQADNSGGLPSSQLKWPPACDSLINRITSLMVRFNSLLGRNKFPVPLRRELPHKLLQ